MNSGARQSSLRRHRPRSGTNGQSMVEFALIVPILLALFVAIADFGRVFAAGVVIEAAARDAAELVAEEYLRNPPGDPALTASKRLASPAPDPGTPGYYDNSQHPVWVAGDMLAHFVHGTRESRRDGMDDRTE